MAALSYFSCYCCRLLLWILTAVAIAVGTAVATSVATDHVFEEDNGGNPKLCLAFLVSRIALRNRYLWLL